MYLRRKSTGAEAFAPLHWGWFGRPRHPAIPSSIAARVSSSSSSTIGTLSSRSNFFSLRHTVMVASDDSWTQLDCTRIGRPAPLIAPRSLFPLLSPCVPLPNENPDRIVSAVPLDDDSSFELKLRPQRLREFIGQQKVKDNLEVAIQAAKSRGEALDHVLLYGPPGLGKTTLANIIANELGVPFQQTSGPDAADQGRPDGHPHQPARQAGAVHRRGAPPAAGAGRAALFGAGGLQARHHHRARAIGAHAHHRSAAVHLHRRDHARGAAVGAAALALRHRAAAGVLHSRGSQGHSSSAPRKFLRVEIDEEGAIEIAMRCRGTPRIANRLLRRVRDYAQVKAQGQDRQVNCAESAGDAGGRPAWLRRDRPQAAC